MDGPAARGHIQFVATADRPTIVRLHLQRANWRLPAVASMPVTFAFGDGLQFETTGSTARDEILADIDMAAFRPLLRGLSATHAASVSFPLAASHEPIWAIDMRSFPPAARGMQECLDALGLGAEPSGPLPKNVVTPIPVGPVATNEATIGLEPQPPALNPESRGQTKPVSAEPPVATLVQPPAALPESDPAAPKRYGLGDLDALRREYGDDPEKLMQGPAWNAPFGAAGTFGDFTEAHLPQPLWVARIVVNDPAAKEVVCFYDHADARLLALASGTPVHVSGSIITFLDDALVLSNNCGIDSQ